MKERIKVMVDEGKEVEFDVSKKTCHKFGYYPGDRIFVPYGFNKEATVMGVKKDELWNGLWIKIDGETHLKHFSSSFTRAEFEKDGGKLIRRASEVKEDK